LPFKPFRKKDLNTTSATTVHEEVAVDPSSDPKVPVDESKKILALLELELAMIHQLECAAISGAGGAQLTAEVIRRRAQSTRGGSEEQGTSTYRK
jgi:hypothetical protein